MKRVVLPAGGLATDPNPYITAAQGAMRRADDVVFKHPNVASVRPSFPTHVRKAPARSPRAIHVYQGVPVVSSVSGSTWSLETDVTTPLAASGMDPPNTEISPMQFVEARENLYFTTASGVQKITDPTAAPVAAGLRESPSVAPTPTTAAGTVLPTGSVWAYRACFVREDANGVVVRSAPSPWFTYENASGGGLVATWAVPLAGDVIEGDVLELYRSLAVSTGSTPSDILFLSNSTEVTSTHVTNGVVPIADLAPEAGLGAELYTNSTRDGARKANYQPPPSVALARFSNCVWYGNTTERQTLGFQFKRAMSTSVPSSNADGVCAGTREATGTAGNAFFTMAAGTGGIHIGMYVWDAATPNDPGTYFDAATTVTSIVGTTIGISAPLVGSPAGATVNIGDAVTVGGDLFYAVPAGSWTAGTHEIPVYVTGDHAYDVGKMAQGLAYNITVNTDLFAYATEDPLTAGSVIVRQKDVTAGSFSASWTTDVDSASEGSIVSLASDLSQTSTALTKPNRIYYSKPDEPEHVPVVNYVSVGDESAPIYAMARSRNALLVFKRDGIFKITGSAPDSWRVDEIDSVTRVFRGSCVAEMGGIVYAWTNRGAVAVSELGVQNLSARAISRDLDPFAYIMSADPGTDGCYVVTWPDTQMVLFGVPVEDDSPETGAVYVYCETTGRWSRWTLPTLCAAADRKSTSLFLAKPDTAFSLRISRYGMDVAGVTGFDQAHSLSGWTYDGALTVTTSSAQRGAWGVPQVGDWLSASVLGVVEYREVTAVTNLGTGNYACTIPTAFSDLFGSSHTAYEGITPTLEWQPVTAPDAFSTCLFREVQVALDVADVSVAAGDSAGLQPLAFDVGGGNERSADATTKGVSVPRTSARRRVTVRAGIDREVARGTEFAPYLSGSNPYAPWHCDGMAVVFAPDGGDAERSTR